MSRIFTIACVFIFLAPLAASIRSDADAADQDPGDGLPNLGALLKRGRGGPPGGRPGVVPAGPSCKLHWKHARELVRLCKDDWHQWNACHAAAMTAWRALAIPRVPTIAAVVAACTIAGKDIHDLIDAVRKMNLVRADKDKECYPTDQAFLAPTHLDPNEMPPDVPMSVSDFHGAYGTAYNPVNEHTSPKTKNKRGMVLAWVYNTMLVVSNSDYDGQLRNLMTGLLQPVPAAVEARAGALLTALQDRDYVVSVDEMLASRMGPSNTLQQNKNGAQDAWKNADEYIQEMAADEEPLTSAKLTEILTEAHAIMFTGEDDSQGGSVRGSGEETPVSGSIGQSDYDLFCVSKIPQADMRLLSTRPDGNPVQYLDSEVVGQALSQIHTYIASKLLDGSESVVVLAARYMMALASIHPFHDGNGRIARLMMDFLFYRAGLEPPTNYNAMIAIFPRNEICWQPSPVAAANEVMKGLHNTYGLAYAPLPAAAAKSTYCPAGPKTRIVLPL